jgi:hypothetical protein
MGPRGQLWAVVLAWLALPAGARASNLDDIARLEEQIQAVGIATEVSRSCPANHAGFYEDNGQGQRRLVICRNTVNMADADAVWEVMAHEATHIMQSCTGSSVIADQSMPRTYRDLQTMAPHYAKLIGESYPSNQRRLEAEAFWMELQTPEVVLQFFRRSCGETAPKAAQAPAPVDAPVKAPAQAPAATRADGSAATRADGPAEMQAATRAGAPAEANERATAGP